jgi:hypothetical protein
MSRSDARPELRLQEVGNLLSDNQDSRDKFMLDTTTERPPPKTPPYVSWRTFKSLLQDLHEHGVPSRIDRSILTRYSGVVGTQLMTALRFFNFIDNEGNPSEAFKALVRSYGTPAWSELLDKTIREFYKPLMGIGLECATQGHFSDTFKKAFPGTDAVMQKCATFFLYAARDAGIKISDRVLKGRKPRPLTRKRTVKPQNAKASDSETQDRVDDDVDDNDGNEEFEFRRDLLNKFPTFDPAWPDNIKAEWFKAFEQLRQMTKK